MPNPHEAVYDVLLAQKRRREEQERVLRKEQTLEEAYEEWTQNNQKTRNHDR